MKTQVQENLNMFYSNKLTFKIGLSVGSKIALFSTDVIAFTQTT